MQDSDRIRRQVCMHTLLQTHRSSFRRSGWIPVSLRSTRPACRRLHLWSSRRQALSWSTCPAARSCDPCIGMLPASAPATARTACAASQRPGSTVFLPHAGLPPKRSTGTGRPTFATVTLPPPHEVGSDPPALACLRAIPSGAVALRSVPLGHSAIRARRRLRLRSPHVQVSLCTRVSPGVQDVRLRSRSPWFGRSSQLRASPGLPGRCPLVVASVRRPARHRSDVPSCDQKSTSRPPSMSESVARWPLARPAGPMLPWAFCAASTRATSACLPGLSPAGAPKSVRRAERPVGRCPWCCRPKTSVPVTRVRRPWSEHPCGRPPSLGRVPRRVIREDRGRRGFPSPVVSVAAAKAAPRARGCRYMPAEAGVGDRPESVAAYSTRVLPSEDDVHPKVVGPVWAPALPEGSAEGL